MGKGGKVSDFALGLVGRRSACPEARINTRLGMDAGWMYLRSPSALEERGRRMRSAWPRCCGLVRGRSSRRGRMLEGWREDWA